MLEAFLANLPRRKRSHWSQISRDHVARRRLRQSELADVTRQRRLRYFEAAPAKYRQQFILGVNHLLPDDTDDGFLPCMNIHRYAFLCNTSAFVKHSLWIRRSDVGRTSVRPVGLKPDPP